MYDSYTYTFYRSTFVAATILILAVTLISEANSSCNAYDISIIILYALLDIPCLTCPDSITMEKKTGYTAIAAVTQEFKLIATKLVTSMIGTLQ